MRGITSIWVFILVSLGAFTTSIGAGMAFPDWPLSNGSLNPIGWLDNLSMFAEHAHRLSAGIMATLTIVLAFWIHRVDERRWLRRASVLAVVLVLAQAIVGGLRVLLEQHQVSMLNTSVGRLFADAARLPRPDFCLQSPRRGMGLFAALAGACAASR